MQESASALPTIQCQSIYINTLPRHMISENAGSETSACLCIICDFQARVSVAPKQWHIMLRNTILSLAMLLCGGYTAAFTSWKGNKVQFLSAAPQA